MFAMHMLEKLGLMSLGAQIPATKHTINVLVAE
jgi:hypothetical protein